MYGFPLNTAKRLMRDLIGHLRPIDTFNMILFSGGSTQLAPARSRQRKRTCGVPSRYWKGSRVAVGRSS